MRFRFRNATPARSREQIERDLDRLGVGGTLRKSLGGRIEMLAPTLSEDAYQAALIGIAAASEVQSASEAALQRSLGDLREVQRLLAAFSDEMHKLDGALRVLSTYVQRMRPKASATERPRSVH